MKIIDDGYYSWLVQAATLEDMLDMPCMAPPKRAEVPTNLIPFSKIRYSADHQEYVHFYEHDVVFREFLSNPEPYIESLYPFAGIITPDCSLYRDMPLALQIANTYMNRAVGCYMQEQGLNAVPNIRWGDERSYQPYLTETPFAFLGVERCSTVSVSTYGCIRGKDNERHFHDGFMSMLKYLDPRLVLVHGAMPTRIFEDTPSNLHFVQYTDWIAQKKRKVG